MEENDLNPRKGPKEVRVGQKCVRTPSRGDWRGTLLRLDEE